MSLRGGGLLLQETSLVLRGSDKALPSSSDRAGRALAGMGIVALGLPLYAFYARRLAPDRPEDWLAEY